MEKCYSFGLGDVVVPKNETWIKPHRGVYYICGISEENEYVINSGAWFDFDDWELVHRATAKSLKTAMKLAEVETWDDDE